MNSQVLNMNHWTCNDNRLGATLYFALSNQHIILLVLSHVLVGTLVMTFFLYEQDYSV